jgi:hypothetical protein
MVRRYYKPLVILLLFGILIAYPVTAQINNPGNPEPLTIPETGHTISGEFLIEYQKVSNPEIVFGNPITEPFYSKYSNRIVQYFENARFELLPENPAELRVRITPLGEILYEEGDPLPVPENYPTCLEFKETKYQVCFSFLEFFQTYGGVPVFGLPISNFELQDNLIVQYFQNCRMEWRPENPPGQRVVLTPLGKISFDMHEDSRLLKSPLKNNLTQNILRINGRAFVEKAVSSLSDTQIVYVIVQNQNNQPVSDAQAYLYVTFPFEKEARQYVSDLSDANGIIKVPFNYEKKIPGIVTIQIKITYPSLPEAETVTSFRVWW